jgi:hypothetical protein
MPDKSVEDHTPVPYNPLLWIFRKLTCSLPLGKGMCGLNGICWTMRLPLPTVHDRSSRGAHINCVSGLFSDVLKLPQCAARLSQLFELCVLPLFSAILSTYEAMRCFGERKTAPAARPSVSPESISTLQQSREDRSSDQESHSHSGSAAPQITLPNGGGALRSIDEKFSVNAANGTCELTIPFPFSRTRSRLDGAITLHYNSGSGNGPFALGWNISLPSIQRRTDKQLPRYEDDPTRIPGSQSAIRFFLLRGRLTCDVLSKASLIRRLRGQSGTSVPGELPLAAVHRGTWSGVDRTTFGP